MRDCNTRMSLKHFFQMNFHGVIIKKCFWPSSEFIHVCVKELDFFIKTSKLPWLIYKLIIKMSIISSCSQVVSLLNVIKGFKTLPQVHWRVLPIPNPCINHYNFYS